MYNGPLSLERFEKYFDERRLGEFYFPNGECLVEPAERKSPARYGDFSISLIDLYKSITGWDETGKKQLELDQIAGVLAFGDSVRYPLTETRKKYYFWGPEIFTKKPEVIRPTHADILILTHQNLECESPIINPITYPMNGSEILLGGIRTHIASKERLQYTDFNSSVLNCGDPTDGVIIIGDNTERLEALLIDPDLMPHTISWKEDYGGELDGGVDFIFE